MGSDLLVLERRIAMARRQKDLEEEKAREEERGVSKVDAADVAAAGRRPTLASIPVSGRNSVSTVTTAPR